MFEIVVIVLVIGLWSVEVRGLLVGHGGDVAEGADWGVKVCEALVWGTSRVVCDVPAFLGVFVAVDEVGFHFCWGLHALSRDCC